MGRYYGDLARRGARGGTAGEVTGARPPVAAFNVCVRVRVRVRATAVALLSGRTRPQGCAVCGAGVPSVRLHAGGTLASSAEVDGPSYASAARYRRAAYRPALGALIRHAALWPGRLGPRWFPLGVGLLLPNSNSSYALGPQFVIKQALGARRRKAPGARRGRAALARLKYGR